MDSNDAAMGNGGHAAGSAQLAALPPLRGVTALVAQESGVLAAFVERALRRAGAKVVARTFDADEAVRLAGALRPNLLVLEIALRSPTTGLDAAADIYALYNPCIVLLTAVQTPATRLRARELGIDAYLNKPMDARQIVASISAALKRRATRSD